MDQNRLDNEHLLPLTRYRLNTRISINLRSDQPLRIFIGCSVSPSKKMRLATPISLVALAMSALGFQTVPDTEDNPLHAQELSTHIPRSETYNRKMECKSKHGSWNTVLKICTPNPERNDCIELQRGTWDNKLKTCTPLVVKCHEREGQWEVCKPLKPKPTVTMEKLVTVVVSSSTVCSEVHAQETSNSTSASRFATNAEATGMRERRLHVRKPATAQCSSGQKVCGSGCYDPEESICCGAGLATGQVCGKNQVCAHNTINVCLDADSPKAPPKPHNHKPSKSATPTVETDIPSEVVEMITVTTAPTDIARANEDDHSPTGTINDEDTEPTATVDDEDMMPEKAPGRVMRSHGHWDHPPPEYTPSCVLDTVVCMDEKYNRPEVKTMTTGCRRKGLCVKPYSCRKVDHKYKCINWWE